MATCGRHEELGLQRGMYKKDERFSRMDDGEVPGLC